MRGLCLSDSPTKWNSDGRNLIPGPTVTNGHAGIRLMAKKAKLLLWLLRGYHAGTDKEGYPGFYGR
jgi:hypothetical protein